MIKNDRSLRSLWRCCSGATAIEYSVLAGLIALVLVVTITTIGTTLEVTFDEAAAGVR